MNLSGHRFSQNANQKFEKFRKSQRHSEINWPLKSHDQLNNREKWLDYFKANPIGKLYNFYHEAQEVGLDVSKFSLFDYGDHPYEHRPMAVAYKQSLDYEDIE